MHRVLIVDDEDTLRFIVAEILTEAGYEIHQAAGGQEALDLMQHGPEFDVVLSDMKMPGMDGLQLLREIKARFPDTLVVMITSHNTIEPAVQSMREGAVNYLLKPISKRQLLEGVRDAIQIRQERQQKRTMMDQVVHNLQALGMFDGTVEALIRRKLPEDQPGPAEERFLRVRDLIVDQHRLAALFQGRLLELTPTEFEILYCLAQAAGRVVSFEEVAFRLRGVRMERDEARTLLSSHFTNLRAKLREAGGDDYLMNSRSHGYFIQVEPSTPDTN